MNELELFIALQFAWCIAAWNMLVAGYFVFMSGSRDELLLVLALLKGLLGGCVYILVHQPQWVFYEPFKGTLLPFTLFLFLMFSMLVTIVTWRAFGLDPPWTRARKIIDATTSLDLYPPKK